MNARDSDGMDERPTTRGGPARLRGILRPSIRQSVRQSWNWRLLTSLAADDAPGLAAELAYRVFLALIPGLLFVAAVFSFVAQAKGGPRVRINLQQQIERNLPPETANFISPYLTGLLGERSANVLSAGILLSLWTVSSVITTVMKASARILRIPERRSYLKQRGQALLLAALLPVLLLISLVLTWFGDEARRLILGHVADVSRLMPAMQTGAALPLAVFAIGLLLRVAAPRPLRRRTLLLGAVTTVIGLWLSSELFAVYAGRFVHYGSTYGLLGGALALVTWLYICAFCLLAALELMAMVQDQDR